MLPCHCERSEAISDGLPRAHALAMMEVGRSMVEMLGVLAMMGIVGLVGVRMYTNAMNKHRANELIYEAQKRATMVAMQITAGQENLSIANFTNPTGYTFGVEKNPNNANQFNITITGVDSKVCEHMKTAVGPATPIRVISEFCDTLTFNNDLSTTAYASDAQDATSCASIGTWCTKGDNGAGTQCSENADCCTGVEFDSQCQTCASATGTVSNKANNTPCDFDGDGVNDSFCNTGVCVNPNVTAGATCTSNADCGGAGSGYYCKINYSSNNLNGTIDNANTDCYQNLTGTCQVIGGIVRQTTKEKIILTKAGFSDTFVVGPQMNWWSAKNWCEAQGKHLLDVEDMECYYKGNSLIQTGGTDAFCCKSGQLCQQQGYWSNLWNGQEIKLGKEAEVAKFSDKLVALRQIYGTDEDWFWLASPYGNTSQNSCKAFRTYLSRGEIAGYQRQGVNVGYKFYPMCQ